MSSKQPGKQRKEQEEAPMHRRQKTVHANLDEDLREEYGTRSLALREGDEVKVTRGDFAGLRGEVRDVDLSEGRVTVDSVEEEKADGTERHVPLHPSNLQIVRAVMDDPRRVEIIERAGGEAELEEREETEEEEAETETEGVKCPVCGDSFPDSQTVNQHITSEHKDYAIE